jgi:hypothetical protein
MLRIPFLIFSNWTIQRELVVTLISFSEENSFQIELSASGTPSVKKQ